jgi:BioD-like phosphotransacetylase family protein
MIIYVASVAPYAGKTLTILGLGWEIGKRKETAYLKTLGNRPVEREGRLGDEDALFLAEVLGLEQEPEELCALLLTQDVMVEAFQGKKKDILSLVRQRIDPHLSKGKVVISSGFGTIFTGKFLGASNLEIARQLGAKVILVVRFEGEFVVDYLLNVRDQLKEALCGVVVNAIPSELQSLYQDLVRPFLLREGFSILAEIPLDPVLKSVSVKELKDFLSAQVITSREEDRLVERFLIGGMQVDKAVTYFKKTPHFGVIVGGDRSDIQLAAIETGAVCLILTGNLYPNEIIVSRAEERGVAILVVPEDTYSTAQKIERLPSLTRLRHPLKLERAKELMQRHLDQDLLWKILEEKV